MNTDVSNVPNTDKTTTNPFLHPSTLPHGAFPFDRLEKAHYTPALDSAILAAKDRLEIVRNTKEQPSFENTILALETCSEAVGRVASIFFNLLSADSDDELQAMAREISPKLANFSSDVLLDPILFQRVKTIWDSREKLGLKGEDFRLTEKSYKDFARNGGLLDEKKKEGLRSIDQELAKLSPEFSDNVLKATNEFQMFVTDSGDLEGLPESSIEAAAQAAKEAGKEGQWLFTLHAPSYAPFMTYSAKSGLREKMWRAYNSRAYKATPDNSPVALRIATLRHQRAQLLGYKTHANFVLEERMAENPEKVTAFLERMLEKSLPFAIICANSPATPKPS
jgi:peptidyl-dipeptidase Dcp